MGASRTIIDESPVLDQPPKLVNSSRTSDAFACGAMIQSGMMIAKKPEMWRISTIPSESSQLNLTDNGIANLPMSGSRDANAVLKMIEKKMIAIANKVPCHLW